MAQYEHLPVFKTAYDLMIEIYVRTKDFPKEYKYTIWEKLKNYSLDVVTYIFEINSTFDKNDKKNILNNTIKLVEKCKILLRISKDIKIISLKHFSNISIQILSLLKQLEWWKWSMN